MVDCLSDPFFMNRITNIEFANMTLKNGFTLNGGLEIFNYIFGFGKGAQLKNKFMRELTAEDIKRLV